jgi:hypothetical protein
VATNYPGGLDSFSNPSASSYENDAGLFHDQQHTDVNDAVEALEAEIGFLPKGNFSTVKDRLDFSSTILLTYSVGKNPLTAPDTDVYRWYNRTGRTLTFLRAWISVGTAPANQAILVDINKGGTSIWNTTQGNRPSIAATAYVSSAQTTFETTTISDGEYLTFDVDQVGTGTAGSYLTISLFMRA